MVPRLSILAFWICNPRSYIVESICLLYASNYSMFFIFVSTLFFFQKYAMGMMFSNLFSSILEILHFVYQGLLESINMCLKLLEK